MNRIMPNAYIGIDVQLQRPCAFAVVDEKGTLADSGWFVSAKEGRERLSPFVDRYQLNIGIDAPRMPLPAPRPFYWGGGKQAWRKRKASDKGLGRHCEVVVKAHNLGNPQWTPMQDEAPDWMELGFELFEALSEIGSTYEVFPSASYMMLDNDPSVVMAVNFSQLRTGPKDMLDAWMAAATVREFVAGRGMEVGGGDGLGTIILPRPLQQVIPRVLSWPDG